MNKKMVLFVLLVTTILLYDLVFNVTCFFREKCFFFLHLYCGICFTQSCTARNKENEPQEQSKTDKQ